MEQRLWMILQLFGGAALFLYSMDTLKDALQAGGGGDPGGGRGRYRGGDNALAYEGPGRVVDGHQFAVRSGHAPPRAPRGGRSQTPPQPAMPPMVQRMPPGP